MDYFKKLTKLRDHLQDLTFEEALIATQELLEGKLSPVKSSAFLTAMRIKGETPQELAGMLEAMRRRIKPLPSRGSALDLSLNYDGKVKSIYILPSAVLIANACELRITYHYADKVPAKEGVTLHDVFEGLGYKYVDKNFFVTSHQKEFAPELYKLMPLRRELGFRTSLNVVEKLLNPFGANSVITSVFHKPYFEKLSSLCEYAGFQRWLVVKGIEGGIEPLTDRPTFFKLGSGSIEKLDTGSLGVELPRKVETSYVLEDSVEINEKVIEGRANDKFVNWALLCASFLLVGAGATTSIGQGFKLARAGYKRLLERTR